MSDTLNFPPLFRGEQAPPGVDPFAKAISAAVIGCDPGLIIHSGGGEKLSAALVLGPEAPLEEAMAMAFATGLGFSDALGALAPPEVAVHFTWPDGLLVNGARCGHLRTAASTTDPAAEPDWLVTGFELQLMLGDTDPGETPDQTALYEEGCADVDPFELLESWSRHTLVWINTWLDEGMARLHAEWRTKAFNIGEDVTLDLTGDRCQGTFMGLDELGGMLLRNGDETRLIPLSRMLET